ncbi:hypothetical protein [Scytonema sp. HK-05]|nr:hypothetical protein [Scytonema sp. HK-05]
MTRQADGLMMDTACQSQRRTIPRVATLYELRYLYSYWCVPKQQ